MILARKLLSLLLIFINIITPINMAQSISRISAVLCCGCVCGMCFPKNKLCLQHNCMSDDGEPLVVGLYGLRRSEAAGNHNALYSGFSHVLANWHSIMEKTMGDINSKANIKGFSNVLLMDDHHTCLNWGLVLESIGEKKTTIDVRLDWDLVTKAYDLHTVFLVRVFSEP